MRVAVQHAPNYHPDVVRKSLVDACVALGMPSENPFGGLVRPGDVVFIKPNWVAHRYRASCPRQDDVWSTITHPSVILAVADLVDLALCGKGRIIIGDNPSIDADFDELIAVSGLEDVQSRFSVPCEIRDLRPLVCEDLKDYGIRDRMSVRQGDPEGSVKVDLRDASLLYGLSPRRFRGVFTDRTDTVRAHTGLRQEYEIAGSIAKADVYISVPKLKTHHKVGTTLNLKGLVGTVTNKNLLVHWRTGFPLIGGDEYPDFSSWARSLFRRVKKRGAWPGNDTIWRMVVDLYTCLLRVREGKRSFTVIDGITGGQGEGPFCPTSKNSQTLVVSDDLLAADMVATRLMGFDVAGVRYLRHYLDSGRVSLSDIEVVGDTYSGPGFFESDSRYFDFDPPEAWKEIRV